MVKGISGWQLDVNRLVGLLKCKDIDMDAGELQQCMQTINHMVGRLDLIGMNDRLSSGEGSVGRALPPSLHPDGKQLRAADARLSCS